MSDTPLELPPPIKQDEPDTEQVDEVEQVDVDIVVEDEDDSPSILEQVKDLETSTSELLEVIRYDPKTSKDTVGEALSLAHEALTFARARLEKAGR